jgi:hypothetical protein
MFNPVPQISIQQQFHEFHGGDEASLGHNGWWIYPDGAAMEKGTYGALREPPTDPYELAKAKLLWGQVKFERAKTAFEDLKERLDSNAAHGVGVDDNELEKLKSLRAEAVKLRTRLRRLEKDAEAKAPHHIRNAGQIAEERENERQRNKSRVRAIRL